MAEASAEKTMKSERERTTRLLDLVADVRV